jgi:hypothetical protein
MGDVPSLPLSGVFGGYPRRERRWKSREQYVQWASASRRLMVCSLGLWGQPHSFFPVVSPPARAPRGAAIIRNERFASTAARNQRKCWVRGSQIRDQAAR